MMKTRLVLFLFVLLGITACSRQHYYTMDDRSISLFYHNEEAKTVLFASSLDHFALRPAAETDDNLWKISLPLHDCFSYFYIVDGIPTLPDCPLREQDDFGSENCLFVKGM